MWSTNISVSNAVYCCRAGDAARTPVEELKVALDAVNGMQCTFCKRYQVYSAFYRRVGGQGVVQFASISATHERVRSMCP